MTLQTNSAETDSSDSTQCAAPGWSERERLAALDRYNILDSGRESAFDNIVELASFILDAPIAVLNFIASDRQWFKAEIGIGQDELPLDVSICRYALLQRGLFVVEDLALDSRFENNPLVAVADGLRFYAGVLLETPEGLPLGTVCVLDTKPRPGGVTPHQASALAALANQAMGQLELRRLIAATADLARLQRSLVSVGELIRKSDDIADMIARTADLVGEAMGVDRACYGIVESRSRSVDILPGWTAPGIASIAGTYRFAEFGRIYDDLARGKPLIIENVDTDPRLADSPDAMKTLDIGALVNMPVRDRGGVVGVLIVHSKAPRIWSQDELAFLRSVADRLEAGTSQYRARAQQQTLNHEISHRLKNTLAMVQAIASQTLRSVTEREPVDNFERRLLALSSAHDALMQNSWSSADLSDILDTVQDGIGHVRRIAQSGPAIQLGPRAALSFSLIVHELLTNAMKYGAFSTENGNVSVTWTVEDGGDEPQLRLRWQEHDGPAVAVPQDRGFGSRLIELGLVGTGGTTVRYESPGLVADMSAPISHLTLA